MSRIALIDFRHAGGGEGNAKFCVLTA